MQRQPDDADLERSHNLDRRVDRQHHQEPHRPAARRPAPLAERVVVGRSRRLVTITIDLDELPAALTDSFRATMRPHGVGLAQLDRDGLIAGRLSNERFGEILRELGRNAAQSALACSEDISVHDDEPAEPTAHPIGSDA